MHGREGEWRKHRAHRGLVTIQLVSRGQLIGMTASPAEQLTAIAERQRETIAALQLSDGHAGQMWHTVRLAQTDAELVPKLAVLAVSPHVHGTTVGEQSAVLVAERELQHTAVHIIEWE
jgi:hypothetical protein